MKNIIFRRFFLFLRIKIRNHVAKGTEQAAEEGADGLKNGRKIVRKVPCLIIVYSMQHENGKEKKYAAFVHKKDGEGVGQAVRKT